MPDARGTETTLGYNAALVLQAMVQGSRYGFEIMRTAQLPSGTVYPLLRRLEDGGFVGSSWEEAEAAHAEGRPPRRYYAPTPEGRSALSAARKRLMAQQALFTKAAPQGNGST